MPTLRERSTLLIGSLCAALCVTVPASGQLPLEPVRETGQSVTGAYEGWYQNPDGTYSLLVGYFNRNQKEALDIPVGPASVRQGFGM